MTHPDTVTLDLGEIRARALEATPGPWKQFLGELDGNPYWTPRTVATDDVPVGGPGFNVRIATTAELATDDQAHADAAYIAAVSPDRILAILDLLDRAVGALEPFLQMAKSVQTDLLTAHRRGDAASQFMRDDDAELRFDYAAAVEQARTVHSAIRSAIQGGGE